VIWALRRGGHEWVRQDFDEAIRIDPQNASACYFRGVVYSAICGSIEAEWHLAKVKELRLAF
jgi:hypothetical protein